LGEDKALAKSIKPEYVAGGGAGSDGVKLQ